MTGSKQTKSRQLLSKVPQVTLFFWIIKIMAATVGQAAVNLLRYNLNLGLTVTVVIMIVLLGITIYLQFKAKKYIPLMYWLAVVFISVVGTMLSQVLTEHGVSFGIATAIFLIVLAACFITWYRSEGSLSIESIYTKKNEAFYWISIFFAFALATALNKWISYNLNLNYIGTTLLFSAILGLVAVGYTNYKLNSLVLFWLAYVLTRPFGASLSDFLAGSHGSGGLGFGTTRISVVFLVATVGLVIYLTKTKKDQII